MSYCYRLRFAAAIAIVIAGSAMPSSAHSFPEQETPAAGATVAAPPAVTIKYDAPIEGLFDSLQVLDAAGHDQSAGPPKVSGDGLELSVPVKSLVPGDYTVKWRVVCIDTHHTEGSYSFTVSTASQ